MSKLMTTSAACVHYWLCPDNNRAVVRAVCRKCGAERDFDNVRPVWRATLGEAARVYVEAARAAKRREETY